MEIEDKLSKTRFNIDINAHIVIDASRCKICVDKPCLYVCPVKNYVPKEEDEETVLFSWQGCLECGACRVICPKGAIDWKYPRGGFGVCFRYG